MLINSKRHFCLVSGKRISSMDNVVILNIVGLCHKLCHRLNFVKLPGAYLQRSLGTTENSWCLGDMGVLVSW